MIIDFQAHVYPEPYIDELNRLNGAVILEDPDPHSGMSYLYDKKLRCRINTATFQGRDIEGRLEHMNRLGIDVHVLSIPAPAADRFEAEGAVRLARIANDAIAAVCRKYPKRFVGLFTLPTSSVQDSLTELDRSANELGLRGFGGDEGRLEVGDAVFAAEELVELDGAVVGVGGEDGLPGDG